MCTGSGSAAGRVLVQVWPVHTSGSLQAQRSRVRASRTYAVAPYGRMLCAMLASWHYPRVNGQTLVNPTHSSSWDRTAQVAMEMGGLWLQRGNEKKRRASASE